MDGILPLYKPRGMTSHDCVAKARKLLRTKKVGHTGTLDPDVDGVLPLCIGRATKIVEYLTNQNKTYEAEVTLGFSTTTEDASGEVVETKEISQSISQDQVEKVLHSFLGDINQTPPMYSAVKINGKRLYEYAREGIIIDRPSRKIHINEIILLDDNFAINQENRSFRFRVSCSKGTYVRTLAVDIGEKLGYPAHMSNLTRTASGNLTVDQCLTFDEIEKKLSEDVLMIIPIEAMLMDFQQLVVDDETKVKVLNGAVLPFSDMIKDRIAIYDQTGFCLAIYQKHPRKSGLIKPEKVLQTGPVN